MKTTKEVFKQLIEQRGIYKKLGVSESKIRRYRYHIRNYGEYPSEELMGNLLEKAGYQIVQERKWQKSNK